MIMALFNGCALVHEHGTVQWVCLVHDHGKVGTFHCIYKYLQILYKNIILLTMPLSYLMQLLDVV